MKPTAETREACAQKHYRRPYADLCSDRKKVVDSIIQQAES